eukprot:GEMP01000742.1.p1 GENE.GEMP01000742.1~~GEMP01000742.1.p1  ORF type:complete len:378 (+),score=20.73 GEMP01000742.1:191-1324(+)
MFFFPDVPPNLEVAIFSGLITNVVGRIGKAAQKTAERGSTFEREVLHEDITGDSQAMRSSFYVRPAPPAKPDEWLFKITQRCCFSLTSVVCGLIYLDRLTRNQKVMFSSSAWDLIWVSLMVLSEKFWEDNYIHPGHILYTAISDRIFQTNKRAYFDMLNMQFWLLGALDWRLNIRQDVFDHWLEYLRDLGCKYSDQSIRLPITVFVPRPIPNLKVRRTSQLSQSTASTATPDDIFQSNTSSKSSITNYTIKSNASSSDNSDFEERCRQGSDQHHFGLYQPSRRVIGAYPSLWAKNVSNYTVRNPDIRCYNRTSAAQNHRFQVDDLRHCSDEWAGKMEAVSHRYVPRLQLPQQAYHHSRMPDSRKMDGRSCATVNYLH